VNKAVQDYLFKVYLTQMLQGFEKQWASQPTPIYLPQPSMQEWHVFIDDFVDSILDKEPIERRR
jgi:hypothetical protein